jgi:hypothetical protein
MTNVPFEQLSRDQQILAWDAAKKELDALKDREMKMRKHIVESNSHGFDPTQVGTHNTDLGNGWTLKAVVKQSYKLDTDVDKVEAALDKLEDWQADRLVKWSPTMSVSEYKKLDDAERATVDGVLTISIASPTLTLVPPKGS